MLERRDGWIGVDEVGRGPLAGPVVCAAVLLPPGFDLEGLDDSKKLTPAQRAIQRERIERECKFAVAMISAERIDRINILEASLEGMVEAVNGIDRTSPVLVDGNRVPNPLLGRGEAVIKGDGTYAAIAAASILAKEVRDAWMRQAAEEFPGYGFEKHYGYAAPVHLAALRELGPCAIHRKSFEPIQSMLLQPCLMLD